MKKNPERVEGAPGILRSQAPPASTGLRAAYDVVVETAVETQRAYTTLQIEHAHLQERLRDQTELAVRLAAAEAERSACATRAEELAAALEWATADRARVRASLAWRLAMPLRFLERHTTRIVRTMRPAARAQEENFRTRSFNGLVRVAATLRWRFGTPRTLWGITPILTLPLLARCDRLLGLKSDSLVFSVYYTSNQFDINLSRVTAFIYRRLPARASAFHLFVLRLALLRYDVFHLFNDRGIIRPWRRISINEYELASFARHDKRFYTYAYGADVRTRAATLALGRYNLCSECPEPMKYCICDDAEGQGNMARIDAVATAKVSMGDMLAYVPGHRNMHYWPIDVSVRAPERLAWKPGQPLRVAHAPNHPEFKGTAYLVAAIEQLAASGEQIELVRVSGVPNAHVLELFASCHIVADQFTAGFHGYTAIEAMALGRPVICYLRGPDMVIDAQACPMINARPDTLHATLKALLSGAFDLEDLGRRSRAYVEHYYSLEATALRLGAMYIETARFPALVNRRIEARMQTLKQSLPPLLPGSVPVPWSTIA